MDLWHVSIRERPPGVGDRAMSGPLEGDLIKGTGHQSPVGMLFERTSRPALLINMDDAISAPALLGFVAG